MKKIFSITLLLLISFIYAQLETAHWYFGENAGLDFSSGSPVADTNGKLSTDEGCSSLSDKMGNLLFYTDGITVYNKKHDVMPNGKGLHGHPSSTQSGIIVPAPGNPNFYFIFTVDVANGKGINYSIVDMTLDSGNGDVIFKNSPLPLTGYGQVSSEKITAALQANGEDFWILTHYKDSYFAFSLTADGLNPKPVISKAGPVINSSGYESMGYLKLSPNGKKIAAAHGGDAYDDTTGKLVLADFNTETGKVSNAEVIDDSATFYGIEFSPNSNLLYYTRGHGDLPWDKMFAVFQYNLTTNKKETIVEPHIEPTPIQALQLALDKKIYMTVSGTSYLSVIENPNIPGKGANFKPKAISLNGKTCELGLPPFVVSFFDGTIIINGDSKLSEFCIDDQPLKFSLDTDIPSYTADWDFGDGSTATNNSTPNHTYANPGTYKVTVTIKHEGRSTKTNKTIVINPKPKLILEPSRTLCYGQTTEITTGEQEPGTTYVWEYDGKIISTKESIEADKEGKYTVTVTNPKGCSTSASIEISILPEIKIDLGADQTICEGQTYTLNAGDQWISYQWYFNNIPIKGENKSTLKATKEGTYTVLVKDKNYCNFMSKEIKITVKQLEVKLGDNQTICEGQDYILDAGDQWTTYEWYFNDTRIEGENKSTLKATKEGEYYVKVTNTNGCYAESNIVTLTLKPAPKLNLESSKTICYGHTTEITTGEQEPGTTYVWEYDGKIISTKESIEVDKEGKYTVTVTNPKGCSTSGSIEISILPEIKVDLGSDQTICEGENYPLNAGDQWATYEWYFNDTLIKGENKSTLTATKEGKYYVKVTNANGCAGESNHVKITVGKVEVKLDAPNEPLCEGGSTILDATDRWASYQWYRDGNPISGAKSSTLKVTQAGEYYVEVTTTNGCAGESNHVKITVEKVEVKLNPPILSFCEGGSTTLDAGDQWTSYEWYFNGNPITGKNQSTLDVTQAGEYYVKVTNANGCAGESNHVKITVEKVEVNLNPPILSFCEGGSTTLDAGDQWTSYEWYFNGNPITGKNQSTLDVTQAGEYYVKVTNANGCAGESNHVKITLEKIEIDLGKDQTLCEGEDYPLQAGDQWASYQWYRDGNPISGAKSSTLDVTEAGEYYVKVTNAHGCSGDSNHVKITVGKVEVKLDSPNQPLCEGGSTILDATDRWASYEWYRDGVRIPGANNSTLKVTEAGEYYVKVTTTNGCSGESNRVKITVEKIKVDLGDDPTICEGQTATLKAEGGTWTTYQWYFNTAPITGANSATLDVTEAGEYYVKVTNANGCEGTSNTVKVTVHPLPVVTLDGDREICEGQTATLKAEGGTWASYQWYFNNAPIPGANNATLDVTQTGEYYVKVTDTNTCEGTSNTVKVTVHPLPQVTLDDQQICEGQTATLKAEGDIGTTYQWYFNGSPITGANNATLDVTQEGEYYVKVTNAHGCEGTSNTVKVTVHPLPVVTLEGDREICEGQTATLKAEGGTWASYQWYFNTAPIPGANSATLDVTQEGEYYVTVTDTHTCEGTSNTVKVTVHPLPVVTLDGDREICEGQTATLKAEGGTWSGYQWYFNTAPIPGATSATLDVTQAGEYYVKVTDTNTCEGISNTVKVTVHPLPQVTLDDQQICEGQTATLKAGDQYKSYQWYFNNSPITGANSATLDVTQEGEYYVKVTDTNTCEGTSNTVKITVNPLPVVTLDGDREICKGQTATLKAEGGTWASYQWYFNTAPIPGANSATLDVTQEGEYYVKVTDTNTCEGTSNTVKVTVHPLPVVTLEGDREICEGQTATLKAEGGTWASYQWYFNTAPIPGANSATLDVTEAGEYYVKVTDTNTCEGTSNTVKVTVHPLPQVTLDDQQICEGQTATLKAGDQYKSYQWYFNDAPIPGANNATLDVTKEGEYYVTVTDTNTCEGTSNTVKVTVHPLPVVTLEGDREICEGQTATLKAEGGTWATYQWYFNNAPIMGANSATLDVTEAGEYYVTVTDTNTCEGTSNTVKVTVHPLPQVTLDDQQICEGQTATLKAEGGTWTTYQWYFNTSPIPGANSATLDVTQAGEYYVTVTDTNTCEGTSNTVKVTVHPLPQVTLDDQQICEGQTATLKAEGDIGTTYQWYFNNSPIPGANSATLDVTQEGEYYVTVTNAHGCEGTSNTVKVTVHPLPVVTLDGDREICEGQTATLKAEGGTWASYQWYFNTAPIPGATSATLDVTQEGEYYVQVTDTNTCEGTSNTVKVTVHPLPVVTLDDQREICEGGTTTLDAGNQWTTYQWYFNNASIMGANSATLIISEAGEYYVKVTDTNTCEGTSNITNVIVHPLPVVTLEGDREICEGQNTTLKAEGDIGTTYQWFFNGSLIPGADSAQLNVSKAGEYYVRVTDAHGCSAESNTLILTVHPLPVVTLDGDREICEGQNTTLKAEGGTWASYQWYFNDKPLKGENNSTLTVSKAGEYYVKVTDTNTCEGTSNTVKVIVHPLPVVTLDDQREICEESTATLDAGDQWTSYQWYFNDKPLKGENRSTLMVSEAGEYYVKVTDTHTCEGTSNIVTVTVHPLPVVTLGEDQTICEGQSYLLDATDSWVAYQWFFNNTLIPGESSPTLDVTKEGEYYVRVTDAHGCSGESKPVKLSVKPAPKVELGEDQIICEGQSYLLNPGKQEPGAQYKWSTGEDTPTITVSQTGTYWVEVENSFGCTSRDSVFIKVNPLPQIPLPEHLILCQGNSLVLDAGAAGKYKWSNGKESRTITITQPGEYSVTVTDIYGCSNTATTIVTESAKPVITLEPKQTFCKGETVTLDAGEQQPGATYKWSTKETTQTITVSVSGKYWVTVTNANGCSSTAFVEIDFTSPFIKEVKVNDNTAEIIAIGQHPLEYSLDKIHWQYSPIFRNLEFKVYNAYVRNALGCLSDPFPFGVLNVPNVITPNGDGINDVWELKGLDLYPGSSVKIFDRKGNLLVNSKITQGIIWDGKYLGKSIPTTSYWYIIELTDGRKLTGWIAVRNYNENDR